MDNKLLMILFTSAHTQVRMCFVLCPCVCLRICLIWQLMQTHTHICAYIAHAQANFSLCV